MGRSVDRTFFAGVSANSLRQSNPRSLRSKGEDCISKTKGMQINPNQRKNMNNTLTLKLPYPLRHLLPEIKARGGRFDAASKTWSLPDNPDNRLLADQVAVPPSMPNASPEERVRNVATVAAELLTGLKLGQFTVCETTANRVVIENIPVA
jgi:hypothetical protein